LNWPYRSREGGDQWCSNGVTTVAQKLFLLEPPIEKHVALHAQISFRRHRKEHHRRPDNRRSGKNCTKLIFSVESFKNALDVSLNAQFVALRLLGLDATSSGPGEVMQNLFHEKAIAHLATEGRWH
jgi:hypothetical protein